MADQQDYAYSKQGPASLLLSFVAGYVDSCTFLALFGLFVAQVTGSFVVAGAQIARSGQGLLLTTFAIPMFVIAGAATTLLVAFAKQRRSPPLVWSLALEGGFLTGFLVLGLIGSPFQGPNAALAVIAGLLGLSAMGVQSALVQLLMPGAPSTNVMTTNTTQLAVLATTAALRLRMGPTDERAAFPFASASDRLASVLTVAIGFLLGTVAGAVGYSMVDLWCLLAPISIIVGLLIWAVWSSPIAGER